MTERNHWLTQPATYGLGCVVAVCSGLASFFFFAVEGSDGFVWMFFFALGAVSVAMVFGSVLALRRESWDKKREKARKNSVR